MKVIIFFIGILVGFFLGFGVFYIFMQKAEPIIGEICAANDGKEDVLYLEIQDEQSLNLIKRSTFIRLIVNENLHSHK